MVAVHTVKKNAAGPLTYSVVQTFTGTVNAESAPGKDYTMPSPLTPGNLLVAAAFFQSNAVGRFSVAGATSHTSGDGYQYTYLNRLEFDWLKVPSATSTVHLFDAGNGFPFGYGVAFIAELQPSAPLQDVDHLTVVSGSSSTDKTSAGTASGSQIGPAVGFPNDISLYGGYLTVGGVASALTGTPGVVYAADGPDGSGNTAVIYAPPTSGGFLTGYTFGNLSYGYHAVS